MTTCLVQTSLFDVILRGDRSKGAAMSVEDTADGTRLLKPAFLRGWRRRCPKCGAGPMMRGYLSVRESCPVCGEEFHHHRADDGPAYLTILIVGHLMAPGLHIYFVTFRPEPLTLASIFSVGCVILSMYLLPRIKGALIAYQWARRLHGFGDQT